MSINIDNLMKGLVKASGSEYASIASEGTLSQVKYKYSTGSYLMNAQLSGDLDDGIPGGKTILLAGEPSTGKCARGSEKIKIFINEKDEKYFK